MDKQEQIDIIKKTIGKKSDEDLLDYPVDEKCEAILNWAQREMPSFDTSFVKSIWHNNKKNYGKSSHGQTRSINNIITKFKINVEEYK